MQSQYSIQPPNGRSRACLWKTVAIIANLSGRSSSTRVAKMKAIVMGGDWPRGSCGKKALNRQIFFVGCLLFAKKESTCTQCVFNRLQRVDSCMETAQAASSPKNGSMKPSGSSKGVDSEDMLGQQWFSVQPNDNRIAADGLRQPFAKPPRITLAAVNRSAKYFVARQHVHFPGSTATYLLLTAVSTATTIRMDRIVAVTWQQW